MDGLVAVAGLVARMERSAIRDYRFDVAGSRISLRSIQATTTQFAAKQ
jgi:hypothetical protein